MSCVGTARDRRAAAALGHGSAGPGAAAARILLEYERTTQSAEVRDLIDARTS